MQNAQFDPVIAYHAKSEIRGWNEVIRERATWEGWNAFDRGMIQEMLEHGHEVITMGWSMYQIVKGA